MRPSADVRNKTIILLCLFLFTLVVLTFFPYEFSTHWYHRLIGWGRSAFIRALFHFDFSDVLQNVIGFIPLGWIIYVLSESIGFPFKRRIVLPILSGFLISASVETSQLFLPRSTSGFDVAANVTGTVFGFYSALKHQWHHRVIQFMVRIFKPTAVRASAAALYAAGLFYLLLLPPQFNNLSNWDKDYPLLLGNEATLDRPWDGEVKTLAIFPKALGPSEAAGLGRFHSGKDFIDAGRRMDALVLYSFIEGIGDTVYDYSKRGHPLHLLGRDIDWLPGGSGLRIANGNVLRSIGSAEKVVEALQHGSRFSIEVRFRTLSLNQYGPARIISISANPDERNVTLGQEGSALVLRVRTPVSGWNSSRIYMHQPSALPDTLVHDVVAVFDLGLIRLYRDGIPLKPILRGDIPYLSLLVHVGKNEAARTAFCYLFFFPLGILFGTAFRRRSVIWASFLTMVLFFTTAAVYHSEMHQPFGWRFFAVSLGFAWLGAMTVKRFRSTS
ncbi:MAG TPA: VanZ family protein [bacterium]